jgi:hypothetical protein
MLSTVEVDFSNGTEGRIVFADSGFLVKPAAAIFPRRNRSTPDIPLRQYLFHLLFPSIGLSEAAA